MNPKDLIDSELTFFAVEPVSELDLSDKNLPVARAMLMQLFQVPERVVSSPAVDVSEVTVPGPPGAPDVRCLMYRPTVVSSHTRAVVLEIHGGGFVLGKPEQNDLINRTAAEKFDCVVVAVDYRLAPEAPPLGGVEDCYAALKWVHDEAATLGVDPHRIVIRGDSGGGGVAATLALLARDRGGPSIAFQLLIYPMLDDRTGSIVDRGPYSGFVSWSASQNRQGWRALLGAEPGGEFVSSHQAAARAADLSGLPATFIGVGALDLFLEENLVYATRLARAGVPIELHVYPGAPHAFERVNPEASISQIFIGDIERALKRALV